MISIIAENHYRVPNFFGKIEQILLYFKDTIKKIFSNDDIFMLFVSNKRILLFLFKEKILEINLNLIKMIKDRDGYSIYFLPEIKNFLDGIKDLKKEEKELIRSLNELYKNLVTEDFEEKRNLGENDYYICKLIRTDSIEEFITEYNKRGFSLNGHITHSIFETHSTLLKSSISLIEYASFFGSVQIFRFLFKNNVELTNSLWFYGVHSDNSELISLLEENCPKPESFKSIWIESVKCHHIDVANYIQNNYLSEICYKFFKLFLSNNDINCNLQNCYINDNEVIENKTPLYIAVYEKKADVVAALLKFPSVDVDILSGVLDKGKYMSYKTPLFIASELGYDNIVRILLTHPEIDINEQSEINIINQRKDTEDTGSPEKKTALYIAVEKMNIKVVNELLRNKEIDVNLLNDIYKDGKYLNYDTDRDRYVSYNVDKFKKNCIAQGSSK